MARRQTEKQLRLAARIDYLTGVPNRLALIELTSHLLTRAKQDGSRFGLLFLDCDRFKTINDAFGHHGGDDFLVQLCHRLQQSLGVSDPFNVSSTDCKLCRFGGDEFVVLVPGIARIDQALQVASRVQSAFESPFVVHSQEVQASASIGLLLGDAATETHNELLRDAGIAICKPRRLARRGWLCLTRNST